MFPSAHQVSRYVKALRDPELVAKSERSKDIAYRLTVVLERAGRSRSSFPDGFPTSTIGDGASGSSPGSTTERSALDRDDRDADEFDRLARRLFDMVAQAATSIGAALNTLEKIERLSDPDKGPGQTAAVCCEEFCDDLATGRHAGRCKPCYDWRHRHGGPNAGPVPRSVIQQRLAARGEVVRVHVNGPLAEGAPS